MQSVRLKIVICAALWFVWGALLPCPARSAVSYQREVLEIFRAECLACHNEDDKQGELDLSTYKALLEGGISGSVIEPGDPDESLLYRLVAHLDQPSMPPETPKLARESLNLIKQWISEGAIEQASDVPEEIVNSGQLPAIAIPPSRLQQRPVFPPRLPRSSFQVTAQDPAVLALAASPTSPVVAVGGVRQVWFVRVDSNDRIGRIGFSGNDIQCVQFSADGSLLVVGGGLAGASGRVEIWDVETGRKLFKKADYLDTVTCVAISADHQRLAVASTGAKIDLIDLKSGQVHKRLDKHTDWITDLAFSDDGVLLASADRSGGLHLWESWTGEIYRTLGGHKQSICGLVWTHDSNFIASSGKDGFIRIWSADNGSEAQKIKAHSEGVIAHARRDDGGWISAGNDQVLHVWSAEGKSLRTARPFTDTPTTLVYAPVGKQIITGDYQGRLTRLDETSLNATILPSINPRSLDSQITQARQSLQAQQQRRSEGEAVVNRMKQRVHYLSVLLENENRLLASYRADYDNQALALLQCRRRLRTLTATLAGNEDSSQQSRLLVQRKLAANELKQLKNKIAGVESDLSRQAELVQTRRADRTRQIEGTTRKNKELAALRQRIKESVRRLAQLIEENAYSTRYDLAVASEGKTGKLDASPAVSHAASSKSTIATP